MNGGISLIIPYPYLDFFQLAHIYTKKRREFGKHPKFTAVPAEILESIPSTEAFNANYVMRNPSVACFDTAPQMYADVLFFVRG